MTQQRIPVLLCFLLPAVVAGCGGGDGPPIDAVDPNAPPVISDKQPPATNQNPVTNQNPAASPSTPGTSGPGGGRGACLEICNALPARGCEQPEEGCEEACRPDPDDTCPRESLDFLVCASEVLCPSDFEAQIQQAIAHCPDEYAAFTSCLQSSGQTD